MEVVFVAVPPQEVTIVNMSGENVLTTTLNPILEDQSLQLICTAHGGKLFHIMLFLLVYVDNSTETVAFQVYEIL